MAAPPDIQIADLVVGTGQIATNLSVASITYSGTFSDGSPINGAVVTKPVEISLVEEVTIAALWLLRPSVGIAGDHAALR
jgi:hypothetical protein